MTTVRAAIVYAALECNGRFDTLELAKRCALPLSTVFRNIPLLLQARILRRVFSRGDTRLYEVMFERPSRERLVCEACGRVVEVQCEPLVALRRDIATMYGFELDTYVPDIMGLCAACAEDRD